MNKISIVVNTKKLDKNRIIERKYTNKSGEEVIVKEMKLDIIPIKDKKVITSGNGWKLLKVGFITETPSKQEKEQKEKMPIVGDALQFESSVVTPSFNVDSRGKKVEVEADDIPFD